MKRTTSTELIYSTLQKLDDFCTMRRLMEITGLSSNRASAALISMRSYKAVDCIESNGYLFWYLTPEEDTRSRRVAEREEEEPGSRITRKSRTENRRKKGELP